MSVTTTRPAGSVDRVGYEVANALGRLYEVAPRLAKRLHHVHAYAKAVRAYLNSVDLYCQAHGVRNPGRLVIETRLAGDEIVQTIRDP